MSSSKNTAPGTATFFTQTNYEGDNLNFSAADGVIDLQNSSSEYYPYNDKFYSVELGENTKVYLWQHGGFAGKSQVLEQSDPDITDIGGLSVLQVTSVNTNGIYVRFRNDIPDGGSDKPYALDIKVSEDIGNANISEGTEEYYLVGVIGDEYVEHVAQVSVRGKSGVYCANGSCYFKDDNGDVICEKHDDFPTNMDVVEGENGYFTFILKSES